MRISTIEGALYTIFFNWTTGGVLAGYALALGARPQDLALIAAGPYIAQATSPIAALLASRVRWHRPLVLKLAGPGRLAWLLAALIPFFVPPALRPVALGGVVVLSSIFAAWVSTIWLSWMGGLLPAEKRGRLLGSRQGKLVLIGTLGGIAGGAFIDHFPGIASFQVLLALAVVFALASLAWLSRQPDAPLEPPAEPVGQTLSGAIRSPDYRRFVVFAGYWVFSLLIALPFAVPYFLTGLRMSFTQVALWQGITAVTALAIGRVVGKLSDRAGYRPVLILATLGPGAITPLLWLLASPGNLLPVWLSAATEAFTTAAIMPGLLGMSIARSPECGRVCFTAVLFTGMGVAGLVGGLLSAPLLSLVAGPAGSLSGGSLNAHQGLFALSAILRSLAGLLLRRVPEENAWPVRRLLRLAWRW